jgi:ABC-2 type transport system ATP-binding protein
MIEVRSLSRYYGESRAVDSVSFTIQDHEVVGFLGLNGAGKSTTLKVLAGLLAPSSGSVIVDGVDMTDAPTSFRRHIGYLPEDTPLYREMTVTGFLHFVAGLRGMSDADFQARLPDVLRRCHLEAVASRVIDELSLGFRKRVGIAQAIIHKPRLVILDEPISGLDPVQIVEMRDVIRGLASEATVLVSSHNLHEVSETCDRLLVLRGGRLVAQGTEDELGGKLKSGSAYLLEVRGAEAAVRTALQGVDAVASVRLRSTRGERAEFELDLGVDRPEDVVVALVSAGIGVRRLEEIRGELEGIFLDLNREGAA